MASTSGSRRLSQAKPAQATRLRYGNLPKPPERIEVPYARSRPGLRDLSCGQQTMLVAQHPAFDAEIGRICRQLDGARAKQRGPAPGYTALECELVLLYQRVCGLRSYRAARNRLAGDRADDARRLFGLTRPRCKRAQKLRPGIPSEATISRHLKRFGEQRRLGAYERLFKAIVADHLDSFAEMRAEARLLAVDGSKIETHYTCPKVDKNGEIVNARAVTCVDGGYVGKAAGADKSGHGFNGVALVTLSGLPLTNVVTRLSDSEKTTAERLLGREVKRDVLPHLDQDQLHLLVADGGFQSPGVRRRARELGWVEQIHYASHSAHETSDRNVAKYDSKRFSIRDYPNWQANGHREISCKCGHGQLSKRISRRKGKTVIRTEGACRNCGTISITAGRWRTAENTKSFVRCQPDEHDRADLSFGNPLTYHDPLAAVYGQKRFGHNEGFHAHLTTRFGLYRGKRWFRRKAQARTETAMVFSVLHVLAMEQRRFEARAGVGVKAGLSAGDTAVAGRRRFGDRADAVGAGSVSGAPPG